MRAVWHRSQRLPNGGAVPGGAPGAIAVHYDGALGLLSVEHDGSISWDSLQAIKNYWMGSHCAAIEIYPPATRVVNNIAQRHLWRLGPDDWWPDLGHEGAVNAMSLRERFMLAAMGERA